MNKPAELKLDTVPCWIGGKPVVPAGRMGEVYNPATGQVTKRVPYCDAAAIDEYEDYDLITSFDAIHDQAKPASMLAGISQALRPDGAYLVQDIAGSSHLEKNIDHLVSPFLYTISLTHCMTVSLAYGGEGLGAMWGEEKAVEMMKTAGFKEISVNRLEHDFMNTYYVATK